MRKFTPPTIDSGREPAGRIGWIDWAKALGIYLVVTGHSRHDCDAVLPMIFMIHMPLFFVVSGYLFKTDKPLGEIARRNVTGLVVPYLAYNALTALYWLALGGLKWGMGQEFDWNGSVTVPAMNTMCGVAVGSFDGPTWFLLALVWCKFLGWLLHRGSVAVRVATAVVWCLVLCYRSCSDELLPLAIDCGVVGFIWFEVGYLLRRHFRLVAPAWWAASVVIVAGSVLCYVVMEHMGMCNYILSRTNGVAGIAGTAAGLAAFFAVCLLLGQRVPGVVRRVSAASIVVMCLHMPVQSVIESVVHYQGPEVATWVVDLALVLALTALYPVVKRRVPILVGGR